MCPDLALLGLVFLGPPPLCADAMDTMLWLADADEDDWWLRACVSANKPKNLLQELKSLVSQASRPSGHAKTKAKRHAAASAPLDASWRDWGGAWDEWHAGSARASAAPSWNVWPDPEQDWCYWGTASTSARDAAAIEGAKAGRAVSYHGSSGGSVEPSDWDHDGGWQASSAHAAPTRQVFARRRWADLQDEEEEQRVRAASAPPSRAGTGVAVWRRMLLLAP